MKFTQHSLTGKLILFFSTASIGILIYTVYIVWATHQINVSSVQLESVHFPLAESIEGIESGLDNTISSLREDVLQKDTSGIKTRLTSWNNVVNPGLRSLQERTLTISQNLRSTIDSLNTISIQLLESDRTISRWIGNNYLNIQADSAFLASLPYREQTELLPAVHELKTIQSAYKKNTRTLKSELDIHVKQDSSSINNYATQMRWIGIGLGLILFSALMIGGIQVVKRFRNSLTGSVGILDFLVKGEVTDHIEPPKNEFGVIVDAVNKLNNNLKQYSSFAQSIGEGNVDYEFKPVSESDMLGNSLVQMRQKLKSINEEDRKRNWVSDGLARFADLMRRNDDYVEVGHQLISELVKYTKSNQGGMFIINRDNEKDEYLQLTACYAFERRKYLEKRIDVGEGLVGQAYQEQRTIYLKQIPTDYVTITSGLGGANPATLLIVPLKVNELIEGVLELASFREYQPFEIEFVEKVAEIVASTISNARINTHTRKLLEESQQHSEELRAQEEEMRQNMEEMQATQEQLHRQTDEMRKMQDKLEIERSMFHMLMEYLPDRITYKDKESRILRVNKAKAVRFKMPAEEMIGKNDYDFFSKEHADKAVSEEQELIRSGEPKLNIEEKAQTAEGDVVWASTSRIPFKNDRGEIIGMFIITKDVTELRIAKASIEDKEKVIERLLGNMHVFRYSITRDGLVSSFWSSKNLDNLPALENKPVKDVLPEIHDLIQQEGSDEIDLIGKSVLDINDEKEIFTHYIFPDSAQEGVYNGFAIKQQ